MGEDKQSLEFNSLYISFCLPFSIPLSSLSLSQNLYNSLYNSHDVCVCVFLVDDVDIIVRYSPYPLLKLVEKWMFNPSSLCSALASLYIYAA